MDYSVQCPFCGADYSGSCTVTESECINHINIGVCLLGTSSSMETGSKIEHQPWIQLLSKKKRERKVLYPIEFFTYEACTLNLGPTRGRKITPLPLESRVKKEEWKGSV
jgi:hypothetical protein